jgi:opacity protein-like surface antigen
MKPLRLLGLAIVASLVAATAQAADLTGDWSANGKSVFTFHQHGSQFTGQVLYDGKVYKIADGKIDGDAFSFFVVHDADWDPEVKDNGGKAFRNTAKGTVSGDDMTFSGSREGSNERAYSLTLHRLKNH